MREFEYFSSEIVGEEAESLIEQEAAFRDVNFLFRPTLMKMKQASASPLLEMKQYGALEDHSRGPIQENRAISTQPRSMGCLHRVWQSVSALWNYFQNKARVEPVLPIPPDAAFLQEHLLHVQSLLRLSPFAFSEGENQNILKAVRQISLEPAGTFSLGLLLFLIDRYPEEFINCVEAPYFSKQHLEMWVKQEGKKALYKEIEESSLKGADPVMSVSDRIVKTLASLIMTRAGLCNIGLLEDLPILLAPLSRFFDIERLEFFSLLENRLQLLRNSSKLRQKLHHLAVPESDTVGAACIRASWQLSPEVPLTCKDARKTLLATFLSHLRQQKGEEDCFAVALMIAVMEESPQQVMEDLSSLLTHGALTRVIEGKIVAFPWITSWQERKESNLPLQRGWRQVVASMSETPKEGRCTKRFVATVMPLFHTLGASHESSLACTVETLLKDSFRWFYEPGGGGEGGSKGSFALYKVQGRTWVKITSSKELLVALEEFIQEKWPDPQQRAEKQQMFHAQLATEEVGLDLTNRYRQSFHLAPLVSSSDFSKLHFAPWISYTGGNVESVWHIYYGVQALSPSKKIPFTKVPKTGEELINLLGEWMRWQKKEHPLVQNFHRWVVRITDVHAFSLLFSPSLVELASETVSTEKWIKKHLKDPLLPLSDYPPSEEMREKLLFFVSQEFVRIGSRPHINREIDNLAHQLSLSDLCARLYIIALQGYPGETIPFREGIEAKIDSQIIQLLSNKEKAILERNALLIGDSNWMDEEGRHRYIYLAMHPGRKQLALFVGYLARDKNEPLHFTSLPSHLWLNRRWKLLEK